MAGKSFLEKLLFKLKTGNTRSIHLNALPGNRARLDIYELINIGQSLHLKFLQALLTKPSFKFSISITDDPKTPVPEELRLATNSIIKRLNTLYYQQVDEWQEHGIKTFAFGYPLLIRRDPAQPDKVIKAPVLLWYADLEKDLHKNNSWVIRRSEEHPVIFNEVLRSYIETGEGVSFEELTVLPEDGVIPEATLLDLCSRLLEKLGCAESDFPDEVKILPGTNKATIEKHTQAAPWIRWSGIFGLYKTQKQSIISDVETFLNSPDLLMERPWPAPSTGHEVFPAVAVDPSQEQILHRLKEHHQVIIQGPPGTGKSQSLTAVISDALFHGKSCLVVGEKKTALDVIYQHLSSVGLSELCLQIEDVYRDRKPVVDKMRQMLEEREAPLPEFRSHSFEEVCGEYETTKRRLEESFLALNERNFGDDSIADLMVRLRTRPSWNEDQLTLDAAQCSMVPSYEDYKTTLAAIGEASALFQPLTPFSPLDHLADSLFSPKPVSRDVLLEVLGRWKKSAERLLGAFDRHPGEERRWLCDRRRSVTWRLGAFKLVSGRHRLLYRDRKILMEEYAPLYDTVREHSYFSHDLPAPNALLTFAPLEQPLRVFDQMLQAMLQAMEEWENYCSWRQFLIGSPTAISTIASALSIQLPSEKWKQACDDWYRKQVVRLGLEANGGVTPMRSLDHLADLDGRRQRLLPEAILWRWRSRQQEALQKQTIAKVKHLYNYRSNKKYKRRNSLRKMIHADPLLFTTVFPVVMVNPVVCSSIFPLASGLFDFVLFDEASQLRIEDTFPALFRGKSRIISGDKHQMPPSSWFQQQVIMVDTDPLKEAPETDEEDFEEADDFLAESDSLLEYGSDTNYLSTYLDFHYRSRHPDLIGFSNAAFYGNRLLPMPASTDRTPIDFIQVDGTYDRSRTNRDEALALVNHFYRITAEAGRDIPSIGIATFNLNQRDLIWELMTEQTYDDAEKASLLDRALQAGLFVKNLEHIQGDERDTILISTTFGPDAKGAFRQQFGPITRSDGHKLLNVLITRAKVNTAVFCSIPQSARSMWPEMIAERGNTGNGIFYAYLQYAQFIAAGQADRSQQLLELVSRQCAEHQYRHETPKMPPFYQRVYTALQERFGAVTIRHNFSFGGFLLDIVIVRNGRPIMALLSNAAGRPQPNATRLLLFKKELLTQRGIAVHWLDITEWYQEPEAYMERLAAKIERLPDDRVTDRNGYK